MYKFNIKKLFFIISIMIALYFSLLVIGRKIIFPFPMFARLDGIVCADIINNMESLIADEQGTRIIFLDNAHKVKDIIKFSDENLITRINLVTRDDNYFYVSGVKLKRNSIYIDYERILRYSLDGKKSTVIYEEKKNGDKTQNLIKDIFVKDKVLYVTKFDNYENFTDIVTKVYKIDLQNNTDFSSKIILENNTSYALDSKYSIEDNLVYSTDYFGKLSKISNNKTDYISLTKSHIVYPFISNKNGFIWYDTDERVLYNGGKIISNDGFVTFLKINNNELIFDNQEDSSINIYNTENSDLIIINTIDYSILYFCLLLIKFLSVLYLLVLIVILFIKTLLSKYNEKNFEYLRRVGIISLAVIVIIFISIFYTKKYIDLNIDIFKSQMHVIGDFFAKTIDNNDFVKININNTIDNTSQNIEQINKFEKYYNTFVELEAKYNEYIYLFLFKKVDNKFKVLYDSSKLMQYGLSFIDDDFLNNNFDEKVNLISINSIKAYFYGSYIKNEYNENIGAIGLGFDYNAFHKQEFSICFEMIMVLSTIFVAIYIFVIEVIALFQGLKKKKNDMLQNNKNTELDLIHSIGFFNHLISSFDTMILVLISKDFVDTLYFSSNIKNILIILPTFALGIGSILAPILYSIVAKRLEVRKNLVGSGIIWAIVFILLSFSIIINNYILFCLFVFVKGIFDSYIYTGITSMLFITDNEEERYVAANDKAIGQMSASICGTLLGGFVVSFFGNAYLYFVIALFCIPMIIIFLISLPKNKIYIKKITNENVKATTFKYIKFIFSIPIIAYILFVLAPLIISNGYKSYVFPLFIDSMDMPKMYVTNFYVFARVLTILLIEPIIKSTKKMDYWNLMIFCVLLIGFSFISFAINSTAIWAILMLSINLVLDKLSGPSKSMLWPRQAKAYGLNIIETQSIMTLFERAMLAIKEVVFAFLLAFGSSKGCMIFGIASIMCALLFYLFTKDSAMANADVQN